MGGIGGGDPRFKLAAGIAGAAAAYHDVPGAGVSGVGLGRFSGRRFLVLRRLLLGSFLLRGLLLLFLVRLRGWRRSLGGGRLRLSGRGGRLRRSLRGGGRRRRGNLRLRRVLSRRSLRLVLP